MDWLTSSDKQSSNDIEAVLFRIEFNNDTIQ